MIYRLLGLKSLQSKIDKLEQRIHTLESIAHEPQNYKKKCEEIEERVKNLEAHPAIARKTRWF